MMQRRGERNVETQVEENVCEKVGCLVAALNCEMADALLFALV